MSITRWHAVPGWCDFANTYIEAVVHAPVGATLVEVGCFLGRSTTLLGELVLNAGKSLEAFAYDTFEGVHPDYITEPSIKDAQAAAEAAPGGLEAVCRANADGLPITIHRADTFEAARRHGEGSVWMVWLDNNHATDHVRREIDAWWPAVRSDGWIGGHDYDWPTVRTAVNEWAAQHGRSVEDVSPRSWRIRKG